MECFSVSFSVYNEDDDIESIDNDDDDNNNVWRSVYSR